MSKLVFTDPKNNRDENVKTAHVDLRQDGINTSRVNFDLEMTFLTCSSVTKERQNFTTQNRGIRSMSQDSFFQLLVSPSFIVEIFALKEVFRRSAVAPSSRSGKMEGKTSLPWSLLIITENVLRSSSALKRHSP